MTGKLVSLVFRVIGTCVVIIMLFNFVWNLTTVLTVHYRIMGSTYPLLFSVADNNRLTDDILDVYAGADGIFDTIAMPNGEFTGTIHVLGFDATSVGAMQAGADYGDFLTIEIQAVFGVQRLAKTQAELANSDDIAAINAQAKLEGRTAPFYGFNAVGADGKLPWATVPVTYKYYVPCLRYYK